MIPSKESLTAEFKSDQKKYSDAEIFEASGFGQYRRRGAVPRG